jgi:hypothetical protein
VLVDEPPVCANEGARPVHAARDALLDQQSLEVLAGIMAALVRLRRWPTLTRTALHRKKDEMRDVSCDVSSEIHQFPCELRNSSYVLQNR